MVESQSEIIKRIEAELNEGFKNILARDMSDEKKLAALKCLKSEFELLGARMKRKWKEILKEMLK